MKVFQSISDRLSQVKEGLKCNGLLSSFSTANYCHTDLPSLFYKPCRLVQVHPYTGFITKLRCAHRSKYDGYFITLKIRPVIFGGFEVLCGGFELPG